MKQSILLLAFTAVAFSNCTTSYKTGQTPDDVYYSTPRPQDEYLSSQNNDQQYNGNNYNEDRYLQMKVQNPALWSQLDDGYYYSDLYNYNYIYYSTLGWNNPWNPYSYWNAYYNPYYTNYVILSPTSSYVYTKPRMVNLNAYNNNMLIKYKSPRNSNPGNSYYNINSGNNGRNSGSFLRNIFGGNNGGSFGNSGVGSGSSGGSRSGGGGSAPVRKF